VLRVALYLHVSVLTEGLDLALWHVEDAYIMATVAGGARRMKGTGVFFHDGMFCGGVSDKDGSGLGPVDVAGGGVLVEAGAGEIVDPCLSCT